MDGNEISKRALTLNECMHVSEDGVEYWYARDLQKVLGYSEWRNFEVAVKRARASMESAKTPDEDHFVEVTKMVELGSGSKRSVNDYMLTRYACYLIAMNGDPRKEEIAFAQSYFATQTRRQENIEKRMAEIKRLLSRESLAESEKQLAAVSFERGVDQKGFARIKSKGDKALFGGHDTWDMKKRLGISDRKPLADVLPDVTLAAKNLATSMTAYNVESKDLQGVAPIEREHVSNNASVRDTLTSRGIYPESLPAEEDAKKLKRRVDSDARKLEKESKGFRSGD